MWEWESTQVSVRPHSEGRREGLTAAACLAEIDKRASCRKEAQKGQSIEYWVVEETKREAEAKEKRADPKRRLAGSRRGSAAVPPLGYTAAQFACSSSFRHTDWLAAAFMLHAVHVRGRKTISRQGHASRAPSQGPRSLEPRESASSVIKVA